MDSGVEGESDSWGVEGEKEIDKRERESNLAVERERLKTRGRDKRKAEEREGRERVRGLEERSGGR